MKHIIFFTLQLQCLLLFCDTIFLVLGSIEFTERDVEVFKRYLTFCGIGIQNAQLFESSVLEYKRNQILLNLARSIFEEQNNLECLVTKIMTEARELLKCERCAVFLMDLDCCEAVRFSVCSLYWTYVQMFQLFSLVRQKSHLERMLLNPAAMKEKSMDVQTDLGTEDHENLVKKCSNNPPKFTRVFEMVNK